jgi:hypothetical protein
MRNLCRYRGIALSGPNPTPLSIIQLSGVVSGDTQEPGTMEDNDQQPRQQQTQDYGLRCPSCGNFPRLLHSMLDIRKEKTVRLYQCRCGERIWDD